MTAIKANIIPYVRVGNPNKENMTSSDKNKP
jgi:hypothetical protein